MAMSLDRPDSSSSRMDKSLSALRKTPWMALTAAASSFRVPKVCTATQFYIYMPAHLLLPWQRQLGHANSVWAASSYSTIRCNGPDFVNQARIRLIMLVAITQA